MPTPESIYWQDRFDELRRTELDSVRATAGKWQATIATLLGVFGSVAFVGGISKVDDLNDAAAAAAKTLITVAVGLALIAVLCAAYAAQGIPRDKRGQNADQLRSESFSRARRALWSLRTSQVLSLAATGCVVAGSLVVLFADAPSPTPPRFVVTADGRIWCGELSSADGVAALKVDGVPIDLPSPVTAVVATSSCGVDETSD